MKIYPISDKKFSFAGENLYRSEKKYGNLLSVYSVFFDGKTAVSTEKHPELCSFALLPVENSVENVKNFNFRKIPTLQIVK